MSGSKNTHRYLELNEVKSLTTHQLAEQKGSFSCVVSEQDIHRDKKNHAGQFHAFAGFDGYVASLGLRDEKPTVAFAMPNTVENTWNQTNLSSNINEHVYRIIKAQVSSVNKLNKDKKDTEKNLNYDLDLYIPLSNGSETHAGGHWNYVVIKFRNIEQQQLKNLQAIIASQDQELLGLEEKRTKEKASKTLAEQNSIDRRYNTDELVPLRDRQWQIIQPFLSSLYDNITIEFTDPKHWEMDRGVWRTLKAVFPNRTYSGWAPASPKEWPFSYYTLLWFIPALIVCAVLKIFLASSALAIIGGFWGMLGIAIGLILFAEVLHWWINREPQESVIAANPNKHLSFSLRMDCSYQNDGYTCGDRTASSMVRRATNQPPEDKRTGEEIRAASLHILALPKNDRGRLEAKGVTVSSSSTSLQSTFAPAPSTSLQSPTPLADNSVGLGISPKEDSATPINTSSASLTLSASSSS